MDKNVDLSTIILTSAAVGAVISALVSSFFTLLNDLLQRRQEKQKTILELAVRLTEIDVQRENELMKIISAEHVYYTSVEIYIGHIKTLREAWSKNELNPSDLLEKYHKKRK